MQFPVHLLRCQFEGRGLVRSDVEVEVFDTKCEDDAQVISTKEVGF